MAYQRPPPQYRDQPIIVATGPKSGANLIRQDLVTSNSESTPGCILYNHAHPVAMIDDVRGVVGLWCRRMGTVPMIARVPWVQFMYSNTVVVVPWDSSVDSVPSVQDLRDYGQWMLRNQPLLLTISRWTRIQAAKDDFTRMPELSDEMLQTSIGTVLKLAFQLCPKFCISDRMRRIDEHSYEVNLSPPGNRHVKVRVDRQVQVRSESTYPSNKLYVFPGKFDPKLGCAWSFQKALAKMVAHDYFLHAEALTKTPEEVLTMTALFELIRPQHLVPLTDLHERVKAGTLMKMEVQSGTESQEEEDQHLIPWDVMPLVGLALRISPTDTAKRCGWKIGGFIKAQVKTPVVLKNAIRSSAEVEVPCRGDHVPGLKLKVSDLPDYFDGDAILILKPVKEKSRIRSQICRIGWKSWFC